VSAAPPKPAQLRAFLCLVEAYLPAHHRPPRVAVDLVVLVLPRRAATFAAVTRDGDLAMRVGLRAVGALHQFGVPGGTAPVALDTLTRVTQRHRVQVVGGVGRGGGIWGHGVCLWVRWGGDCARIGGCSRVA